MKAFRYLALMGLILLFGCSRKASEPPQGDWDVSTTWEWKSNRFFELRELISFYPNHLFESSAELFLIDFGCTPVKLSAYQYGGSYKILNNTLLLYDMDAAAGLPLEDFMNSGKTLKPKVQPAPASKENQVKPKVKRPYLKPKIQKPPPIPKGSRSRTSRPTPRSGGRSRGSRSNPSREPPVRSPNFNRRDTTPSRSSSGTGRGGLIPISNQAISYSAAVKKNAFQAGDDDLQFFFFNCRNGYRTEQLLFFEGTFMGTQIMMKGPIQRVYQRSKKSPKHRNIDVATIEGIF